MTSYKTLWPYVRRHVWRLVGGLSALLVVDFLQLLIPRVIKHAVDQLSNLTATPGSLARAGAAIVGMAVLIGVFRYFWRLALLGFARIVETDVRRRLHAKLLTMSPAWVMERTTGDVMALATNDLNAVRMAAGFGGVAVVDALLLGSASIAFMAAIDPTLTLYAMIPMPLIPLLTRYLGRMMHARYRRVQDVFGALTAQVREYVSGVRVVAADARQEMVMRDLDRLGRRYVRENVRSNMISGAFFPLMIMLTNISTAIVIYAGGRMTIFQDITPGDFVAFISYLGLLTWPMMALGWTVNLVQRGAASWDRINGLLDQDPGIASPPDAAPLKDVQGRIEVKDVTYHYPNRTTPALKGLSLTCPAGAVTALVGRTGCGKSTLLNLIPRLLDPPPETVFLDGRPIEALPLDELRGAIGFVPQDGYIFSGTVAENIAFGRPGASASQIEEAARLAELHRDVSEFPKGYQTEVGERGVTLSGGQKQRLALARALIIQPAVLLLDDTLSAVDADVEERVLRNLARMGSGVTTLMASHRVTSLRLAERIHVIEDGRVAESGRHEELLENDGYYARLYHLQMARRGLDEGES